MSTGETVPFAGDMSRLSTDLDMSILLHPRSKFPCLDRVDSKPSCLDC